MSTTLFDTKAKIDIEIETPHKTALLESVDNFPTSIRELISHPECTAIRGYYYEHEGEKCPVFYRIFFAGAMIGISSATEYARRNLSQWSIGPAYLQVEGRGDYSSKIPRIHLSRESGAKKIANALIKYANENRAAFEAYYLQIEQSRNYFQARNSLIDSLSSIPGVKRNGDEKIHVYMGSGGVYLDGQVTGHGANLDIRYVPEDLARSIIELVTAYNSKMGDSDV